MRNARTPYESRRAHATATRDVIDGYAFTSGWQRQRGRFAGCHLDLIQDRASDGAHIEALEDVRAELQQANTEAVAARGLDALNEAMAGKGAQ